MPVTELCFQHLVCTLAHLARQVNKLSIRDLLVSTFISSDILECIHGGV